MTRGFTLALTVPGEPLPKGRPRFRGGQGGYTPKRTRDAEARIVATFQSLFPRHVPFPLDWRLGMSLEFHRRTARRVDTDNLYKLVADALNGVAWTDDEQLESIEATRVYGAGDAARTEIVIWEEL